MTEEERKISLHFQSASQLPGGKPTPSSMMQSLQTPTQKDLIADLCTQAAPQHKIVISKKLQRHQNGSHSAQQVNVVSRRSSSLVTTTESQVSLPNLLPPKTPAASARKKFTLVLDLDETLIHTSFTKVLRADFTI